MCGVIGPQDDGGGVGDKLLAARQREMGSRGDRLMRDGGVSGTRHGTARLARPKVTKWEAKVGATEVGGAVSASGEARHRRALRTEIDGRRTGNQKNSQPSCPLSAFATGEFGSMWCQTGHTADWSISKREA